MALVDNLIKEGWLKTPEIITAFKKVKRADFLPDNLKNLAELNEALPIDFSQTISQPLVVAFMLELLGPKAGDKVLDVGSGSGWTSALLSSIVGEKGKVIALEVISELMEFGKRNTAKYNYINKGIAEFICKDGSRGYKEEAPYDGILSSASAEELPKSWKDQVKVGGRIVAPIYSSIWRFTKEDPDKFKEEEYPGFIFVPLITK